MKSTERRASRRFNMLLPLTVRSNGPAGAVERAAKTRDISFRGLYFITDEPYQPGNQIEFVLTFQKEITRAGEIALRCSGRVVRVELHGAGNGVGARIERYEFLPAAG